MKIINLNNFVKSFNRKNGFDTIDEFFDSKNINEYDKRKKGDVENVDKCYRFENTP